MGKTYSTSVAERASYPSRPARTGANVWGADLTPELIVRAKENAALSKLDIRFEQADVEALPYTDAKFDVVTSQFGHMFAPRPELAVKEMLRVLKPGGTLAFATWPAQFFTGRLFTLTAKYGPPPPPGIQPVTLWGDPAVIAERLGGAVRDLAFTSDTMWPPALSVAHARHTFESFGPMGKLVASLASADPAKLDAFRQELDALVAVYFDDNRIRQDFLLTRGIKV